jgi:hypothetical protein
MKKIKILMVKKLTSFILVTALCLSSLPIAYAADGDSAVFTFVAANGKAGENEVNFTIDTDNAEINHLIFDIVDPVDNLVFDITGTNDPISFPLTNGSVLESEVTFTTASGDKGYDISSSTPTNTSAYSGTTFAVLTTDKNDATGEGGVLTCDADTAIFVNTVRKGSCAGTYTVLANAAPVISLPAVGGVDLEPSTTAPSALTPVPGVLVTDVAVSATFTFSVTDTTDASVQRKMQLYKRLDDDTWNYPGAATYTNTSSRSGTTMTYSKAPNNLEYSTYYKVVYTATDDQGASDTETYYFSTSADTTAPTQISKAKMTLLSESATRTEVISQISFTTTTDNDDIADYYLWTKSYLVAKDILNSDGTRDLTLDTNVDLSVSDEEYFTAFRTLVTDGNYLATMTKAAANSASYFRITGDDYDRADDNDTPGDDSDDIYMVTESLADDIIYITASDTSIDITGGSVPNFAPVQIVNKPGDIFGATVTLSLGGDDYSYVVGEGSLDVWDAVNLYRNIIGRPTEFPILLPDMLNSALYSYASNTSKSNATAL